MHSPNESLSAAQSALDVVAFYEELEGIVRDLEGFIKNLNREDRVEGLTIHARLNSLCEAIGIGDVQEITRGTATQLSTAYPSKIKRLGVANQIVEMVQQKNISKEEIANRFGLSKDTITRFLKAYDAATPKEQAKLRKSSVYDIQTNMESLHAMMLRAISRFELDGEINARNLSEYRQLLTLAQKQLHEMNTNKKLDELASLIEEVLLVHCLPESRPKVISEFQRIGLSGFLNSMNSSKKALPT